MRVFFCEKPSQGKDIARVVGAHQRGSGCYTGTSLVVTWCIGHLVEAAPPDAYGEKYKRWSLDQLPIIPSQWRVEVKSSTAAQFRIVKKILSTATEVVIATDADREGEMIAREILELCNYRGPIQRLWLSALNDTSIRKALSSLRPGRDTLPLYHAALARSRADWLIGMNLSRLFTLLGRQAGHQGVLSVGRVQTPTLWLVVRRDREIARFVAVPYWVVDVQLSADRKPFTARWEPPKDASDVEGRCIRQSLAQSVVERIRRSSTARVASVDTQRVREPPPLPFDLGTLQEVCSRRFSFDVQETLDLAQSLYETHKATTYPRTDCGYLPNSMFDDVPAVVAALRVTDPALTPLLKTLDCTQRSRAWDDAKVTAHHGIIPTLEPTRLAGMSDKEQTVYRLIRSHYLAQFLPHHEFDRTVVRLQCADAPLQARGKRIVIEGWRSVFSDARADIDNDDVTAQTQVLPDITIGALCEVLGAQMSALKTLPPKPYTQGELIKDMRNVSRFVADPRLKQTLKDTAGIGTVATQAATVQGLIARAFLLKKGAALRSSPTGVSLIDAIPAAIADPGTTAIWEQALDLIADGRMTLDEFVATQSAWVSQLVHEYAKASLNFRHRS